MLWNKLKLDNKTAIITGGGRGLGKAMALALAEAGADIVVAARNQKEINDVASEINRMGRKGKAIPTNVAVLQDVERMVEGAISEFGKIDILLNNAGIAIVRPLLDATEEEWYRVLNTNLTAMFLCCKAAGRHMVKQGKGKIINISSIMAFIGQSNFVSYSASKAAVISFTRALAVEWAKYNINVNAIAPGTFYTSFNAFALDDEKVGKILVSKIPLRRVGMPEELGPLVVYLASEASDFMTGETIFIDGGQLAT